MKKLLLCLSLVLCLFLISCGKGDRKVGECYACQKENTIYNYKNTGYYLCDDCAKKSKITTCRECGQKCPILKSSESGGYYICDDCYNKLLGVD